jgi:osmoprotectant transport system permease protein
VALLASNCLAENAWICPDYVRTRSDDILAALTEHVTLTVESVVIGFLVAMPLALVARNSARLSGLVLGFATTVYTIPSLAMFSLLLPFTGLSPWTVVIGLVLYSLTILVRNILTGLASVPPDVTEAARGMGLGSGRILLRVELPLALPAIFAGLRVATVSTVALVTVGALINYGGLGNLIYDGLNNFFKAEVATASVLCVIVAVAFDVLLLGLQWLMTPWRRGRSA